MIASIHGILSEQGKDYVVLDNQGIGFQIYVTSRTVAQMPLQGSEVKLLTWLQVREDDLTLFGFMSAEEKLCMRPIYPQTRGLTSVQIETAMKHAMLFLLTRAGKLKQSKILLKEIT